MPSPLEIVITKRNALALIREAGWTLRKDGVHTKATKREKMEIRKEYFFNRKTAILRLSQDILQSDTPRPVRVQF